MPKTTTEIWRSKSGDKDLEKFVANMRMLDNLRDAVLKEVLDRPEYRVDQVVLDSETTYVVLEYVDTQGVKHSLDLEVALQKI